MAEITQSKYSLLTLMQLFTKLCRLFGIFGLWALAITFVGCTDDQVEPAPQATEPPAQAPPPPNDDLSPISPNVVYPNGWEEITLNANYAKTTITIGAHFTTNRNACGRDAYGAIDLILWNSLVKNVNLAIQADPGPGNYCIDPPTDTYKYMDGTVDIKLPHYSRRLYEFKNGQICSTIQDRAVSDALLNAINQLIPVADKEDCPNGWGS